MATNIDQDRIPEVNIEIQAGVQYTLPLTCYSDELATTPQDITGYVPYAHVRSKAGGSLILNLSPTVTDAANGVITISLSRAVTGAVPPGKYRWDFILKTSGAQDIPVCQGDCNVKRSITEPS